MLISYFIGYNHVNYDETNWKLIIQQLLQDHRAISELSRSQLIDDSLNIARMGSVPYSIAFELSSYTNAPNVIMRLGYRL
jgi:aminopeptidase N